MHGPFRLMRNKGAEQVEHLLLDMYLYKKFKHGFWNILSLIIRQSNTYERFNVSGIIICNTISLSHMEVGTDMIVERLNKMKSK